MKTKVKTKSKRVGPSRQPQVVSGTVWYYENRSSLGFVVECRYADGTFHQPIRFKVPVKMIRESLARMEA